MDVHRRARRGAAVRAAIGSLAGYLIGALGWSTAPGPLRPLGPHLPDDLDRADRWFERYGDRAVLICRLIPAPGAHQLPRGRGANAVGRFLFFSVLGSLPWNAALLLGGILLGANYEALYHAIRPFEIVIYVIVLIGIAVVIASLAPRPGPPPGGSRGRLTGRSADGTLRATEHIVFGAG